MQHENFILEIVKKQNMAFGTDMHYGGICVHAFLWSDRGPGQQKRHILVGRAFIAANRAFDRLFSSSSAQAMHKAESTPTWMRSPKMGLPHFLHFSISFSAGKILLYRILYVFTLLFYP